ncbi:DNA repair protein RadA [Geothrix rubra]|uniref:DNA repair protein RadA n=1 Tax=Geothrix rubra TaxID=2927977 RepID=A0ABQ5Q2F6_9BACT|nr:DNA repair protein RadA [Geothrix rubra]GLH68659.1 DNA repair protein RadA [Geothrix rubra]
MAKASPLFECTACGARHPKALGKCTACGAWDTVQEVRGSLKRDLQRAGSAYAQSHYTGPVALPDVEVADAQRAATGLAELDRVLGGGVVPGMVVLLGGEPGIGKSTLLLQWAAAAPGSVLYASGEESERQIKLRAQRLGAENPDIHLLAETDVRRIIEEAERMKPGLLLVDSIQTLFDPDFESSAGSVSQVRGCAAMLTRWAKTTGTPLVLVGHVTKDGGLAGPKVLEHLVDTVLAFEGDRHHHHRLLRALKNRFGAAFELGVFAMTEKGLVAAEGNPFFLDAEPRPGCAATVVLSGTRPMVVEIQALVAPAGLGIPRRTALGLDGQRLAMLCAVIERRGGVQLHDRDVYVNVAGGLEIEDPAADLAVIAALCSSATGRLLAEKALFMGEVGLTGEVRPVAQLPLRLQEGARLGFAAAAVPRLGLEGKSPLELFPETSVERLRGKGWLKGTVDE